ncbi:hypothetical protein Tco_1370298 [Tanacetum coccineum]
MASAIICLATNQKFNFSKYIFESMVKNLDNEGKILMYPRFVLVFLDNQLEGMATHDEIYIEPSHTKKIFVNMKRQGKGFSSRETPLFPTMMVQAQQEQGEVDEAVNEENVSKHSNDPLLSGGDRLKLKELMGRKIHDIDADEDITLENVHVEDMFGVNDLDGDEAFVENEEPVVNAATTISTIPVSAAKDLSDVGMTLAQALTELKSTKPKAVTTAATTTTTAITRPKAKGLII